MAEKKVSKELTETGVKFTFATGEVVEVEPKSLSADIQRHLILHGLSQKLGDAYSGEDADKCHAAFQGVLKNLQEGKWSDRAGGGGPRISQLAEALSRATKQDVQLCVEKLAGMSDEEKKAVKGHPQIVVALAEIKLEKAQADAKRIQDELKAGGGEVAPLQL